MLAWIISNIKYLFQSVIEVISIIFRLNVSFESLTYKLFSINKNSVNGWTWSKYKGLNTQDINTKIEICNAYLNKQNSTPNGKKVTQFCARGVFYTEVKY